jgi:RNA polymerase sigma factor (sigma-70 family)
VGARQEEFERIALPHTRSLLRVARRLTWDADSAEDLVQETMLAAWRGFHQFRAGTNARAWLFRILINAFHSRGRKSRPALVPLAACDSRSDASDANWPAGVEISEALEALPVEQRTVLLLGVVEGFTCQEMATILGVPMGTVMSRMARAREAMRGRLKSTAKAAYGL